MDGRPSSALVVLCHGYASDARQLEFVAERWSALLPAVAFLLPDAPFRRRSRWTPIPRAGRQWYGLPPVDPAQRRIDMDSAVSGLNALVDATLERFNLPLEACAFAGFSQGGMVALRAGLARRATPRAIVSFSGALFDGAPEVAEDGTRPPIFIFHGEQDPIVPVCVAHGAAARLQAIGLSVRVETKPALGHLIDEGWIETAATILAGLLPPGPPVAVQGGLSSVSQ